jgi:hypothetical protein
LGQQRGEHFSPEFYKVDFFFNNALADLLCRNFYSSGVAAQYSRIGSSTAECWWMLPRTGLTSGRPDSANFRLLSGCKSWAVFLITEVDEISGYFLQGKSYLLILTNIGLAMFSQTRLVTQ